MWREMLILDQLELQQSMTAWMDILRSTGRQSLHHPLHKSTLIRPTHPGKGTLGASFTVMQAAALSN